MEFEFAYLLSLILIGFSFLGFILGMMIDEINKKKSILAFVLSIILLGLGGYYYYVVSQWQKAEGYPSYNRLNHHLNIYRTKEPAKQSMILEHMR